MKMKLKLDLSELRVESFQTTPDKSGQMRGGIFAQSGDLYSDCCTNNTDCFSCWETCYADQCGGDDSFVQCGTDNHSCAAGCINECGNGYTSNYDWVSCQHTACADFTCDRNGTCDTADPRCNDA